jgi:hypothetical protein
MSGSRCPAGHTRHRVVERLHSTWTGPRGTKRWMVLSLTAEFEGLVVALEREGAPYVVVGALAVAVHGAPRATTDIDLLVSRESLDQVRDVARSVGFTLEALPIRFRDGMEMRRLTKVREGDHLTLDLLLVDATLLPVWESRQRIATEAGTIWVASREALIQMKVVAGRPQDIFDVQRLQELDR